MSTLFLMAFGYWASQHQRPLTCATIFAVAMLFTGMLGPAAANSAWAAILVAIAWGAAAAYNTLLVKNKENSSNWWTIFIIGAVAWSLLPYALASIRASS